LLPLFCTIPSPPPSLSTCPLQSLPQAVP
jgi:hypothetical protein